MPRTLLALLLLIPTGAMAAPDLAYGTAFEPGAPRSALRLERCEDGCFARVRFDNGFLRGPAFARSFPLDLHGFAVTVRVVDGAGLEPEVLSIEPPPGYVAEPAEIAVPDGGWGVIAIHPMPLS
jgi:hypothetical protein